jgi:hypothetical protein
MKIVFLGYEISIKAPQQQQENSKNPLTKQILQIFSNPDNDKLSVPAICRLLKKQGIYAKNEFAVLRAISKLETQKQLFLVGFDRISREDGGAIYLAKYSKSKPA